MNCVEFIDVLDAFLDGELTKTKEKEAEEHLRTCENGKCIYHSQRKIKELIKKCCPKIQAPEGLHTRIRQTIIIEEMRTYKEKER